MGSTREFKAGDRAFAKVGRNLVEVRVKARAQDGWSVATRSGKTITVKSLEPPTGEGPAAPAAKAEKKAIFPSERAAPVKGLSLLSAAAAVLERSGEPLSVSGMIAGAKEAGLWKPGAGKTPEQTLYSAIIREIKLKGPAARFRKDGRGRFSFVR